MITIGSGVIGSSFAGGMVAPPSPFPTVNPNGNLTTLALDASGDLAIPFGVLRGDDAIVQRVQSVLRMFQGEWFLDTRIGIAWRQKIIGKRGVTPSFIGGLVRGALLQIPQVIRVVTMDVALVRSIRQCTISFTAQIDDGRTLTAADEPIIT